ncbi:hypothetical protein P691DRAFT_761391 [Macrolepiota fuliginosa MF-IS2]|uniref:Uncharacterized protein n=1 Tax=Macrolepiota fuliginosa MF-IS2 TaxID=1400762 RepID=A0A9P5X8C0_9AGAR|nr:hypothetical protein P691DRAFT_761391 [Macrolepiota fuliginosa MF-IS2]
MAHLVRSAKSGSDCSVSELLVGIQIAPPRFSPSGADPSLDRLDARILINSPLGADDPILSDMVANYLGYLDFTSSAPPEITLDHFVVETLKLPDRTKLVTFQFPYPL